MYQYLSRASVSVAPTLYGSVICLEHEWCQWSINFNISSTTGTVLDFKDENLIDSYEYC